MLDPDSLKMYEESHEDNIDYINWVKKWTKMESKVKTFCTENDIKFVNTQIPYKNNLDEFFCDGVHQTINGHILMAKYLNENL